MQTKVERYINIARSQNFNPRLRLPFGRIQFYTA